MAITTDHHRILMITRSLVEGSNEMPNDRVWLPTEPGGEFLRRINMGAEETRALLDAVRELGDEDLIVGVLEAIEEEIEPRRMGFDRESSELVEEFAEEFGVEAEWFNPDTRPPVMMG
jgi:hypothetical protein